MKGSRDWGVFCLKYINIIILLYIQSTLAGDLKGCTTSTVHKLKRLFKKYYRDIGKLKKNTLAMVFLHQDQNSNSTLGSSGVGRGRGRGEWEMQRGVCGVSKDL